jgi:hypothetical protein
VLSRFLVEYSPVVRDDRMKYMDAHMVFVFRRVVYRCWTRNMGDDDIPVGIGDRKAMVVDRGCYT